jgi:phage portal protein BeeE
VLFEPIYSLPAAIGLSVIKAPGPGNAGYSGGMSFLPHGARYTDEFRKDRAPTPRELIRQITGVAYACAHLNADAVASTRLRLFVRTAPNEPATRWTARPVSTKVARRLNHGVMGAAFALAGSKIEEVTDHPLLRLLDVQHAGVGDLEVFGEDTTDDEGQPDLSGHDLIYLTQLYLESVGRAYWLLDRDALGVPRRVRLLRAHLVRELPDPTGRQVIAGYEYGSTCGAGGWRYDPRDVLRFSNPDPDDPYRGGYAPLMAAIEKIRIARKGDAHVNALLDNMARPDAIWSPRGDSEGGGIGEAEARRVRSAMREEFNRAGRGGLLISEYPGSLQVLGWKPGDVVELERAKAIKTDIANAFGVPNAMLDLNEANLASAKSAEYQYARRSIQPRCNRLAGAMRRLLRMYDTSGRLLLTFDSPLADDEVFALEQNRVAASLGAVTRNEMRAALDLGPVAWGETPLVPNNMTAVDPVTGKPEVSVSSETSRYGKPMVQAPMGVTEENSVLNKSEGLDRSH